MEHRTKTAYLVKVGLLSGLAFVLMYLDFPIPFLFPEFLKMDFGDLPALIAGFSLGPVAGVLVQLIKNVLYFMTKSSTAGIGSAANFLTGVALVVPAALIYRRFHSQKGALAGMLVGILSMTVVMTLANYYIFLPLYIAVLGFPREAIIAAGAELNSRIVDMRTFVIFATAPFNLMKGTSISIITLLLYKHISRLFKRM